jgi:hypothetical protein
VAIEATRTVVRTAFMFVSAWVNLGPLWGHYGADKSFYLFFSTLMGPLMSL